ncbi:pfkB family carbohydrate kinase [Pedobacter suwonensis]|uniref:PfkB family carbohydrate kinase n=1 Tax=Pedobacter suwonensis TaxID=332999 RepID=A0A1I0U1E3_9SPHI|nr:PfkB family carbohydrate kinase [Pedobacter suwonensis]SFA57808.1 pfkB family carbohydrate kinase [Pedobacter suwonensis]
MISVVGGIYREIDYDDISMEIFGSGFRCVKFLLENKCEVKFNTAGNLEVSKFLTENKKVYENFDFNCLDYEDFITFKYSFALDNPTIFPNILNIKKSNTISVTDENIICYGMLETDFSVKGSKVVYDPQTSIKPIKFKDIGVAEELIYIVNLDEARSISSSEDINEIKRYFFNEEKVKAVIIKNGPYGATLYQEENEAQIPSFITDNVNKIGSGDIFTASFGYYWMEMGLDLEECALYASMSTALYCDKKIYINTSSTQTFSCKKFVNNKLTDRCIYLAAPIFSIAELILIDKIRNAFLGFGVKVFSPFHDIGLGDDATIAKKDIEGIDKSDIVFCVLDNLDSGTLVEIGYSIGNGKKMIGYHRTCYKPQLTMLNAGDVTIYNNLTTAIYHTIWNL